MTPNISFLHGFQGSNLNSHACTKLCSGAVHLALRILHLKLPFNDKKYKMTLKPKACYKMKKDTKEMASIFYFRTVCKINEHFKYRCLEMYTPIIVSYLGYLNAVFSITLQVFHVVLAEIW